MFQRPSDVPIEMITTQDTRSGNLCELGFIELALRDALTETRRATFPARSAVPVDLGKKILHERAPWGTGLLLRTEDGMLIMIAWRHGSAHLAVAGTDETLVDDLTHGLVARLRDSDPDDGCVPVTFWAGGVPPTTARRRVAAPLWPEIASNYAAGTRDALEPLMAATRPGAGGLLLWHGDPGTGKSYALRALAREWQRWCDIWFISDPEVFLGPQSYLLQALLRSESTAGPPRHRLIVLEDAGELLAADARAQAGQALSRLLNLTDGLLGAGLRASVLVTTNEPLRKLHPAVVRPGRCWAEVEFAALSADEASAWLSRRARAVAVDGPVTVAELFAHADGRAVATRLALGFGV